MKKTLFAIGLAVAMTPLTFAGQQPSTSTGSSNTSNTATKKSNKKVKKQKKSTTATKNSTSKN
jgi:hypothetical protein